MPTEVKEHEERSHSARYLILIFLVCVATCGVFFSLGFLVGYNERGSRLGPSTEVVMTPSTVPPPVNPPPDSAVPTPQDSTPGQAPTNPTPETEVVPPTEGEGNPPATPTKPAEAAPVPEQTETRTKPASNLSSPAAGEVGEGITLQVVATRSQEDAQHIVDILKEKSYPVFLATPEYAHADDSFFRVLVGPFRTREEADKARDQLVKEGFKNPFIRR